MRIAPVQRLEPPCSKSRRTQAGTGFSHRMDLTWIGRPVAGQIAAMRGGEGFRHR
jgi:hypothetical protein